MQLPGGDWIDPQMVSMLIGVREVEENKVAVKGGCVVIGLRNGTIIKEWLPDDASTFEVRDQIAEDINRAVYPFSTP